ncbi:MAG: tRNA (guanosine(46)-N7)-methyltransferase TrmB [Planctomycetota bacterium]|nr:tRNA (guanosine(46)-N7)-methyltransferase TrmB [Planctomycetota bacterium]
MSLGRGNVLDVGRIGVTREELPPLPDAALTDREAGRLDPRWWFAHPDRPFEIEIGPGKGAFLVNQCPAAPGVNYLGIEWEGEIYAYAADRLRRRGVDNCRMLHGDANEFLRWRCPAAIARVVHLYFSDPWPKTKHHKNRVVQDRFLAEIHRVLTPGGELRVVTDHDELWDWDEQHFARWTMPLPPDVLTMVAAISPGITAATPPYRRQEFVPPDWVGEGEVVGTNYERKFTNRDKRPHACVLVKV